MRLKIISNFLLLLEALFIYLIKNSLINSSKVAFICYSLVLILLACLHFSMYIASTRFSYSSAIRRIVDFILYVIVLNYILIISQDLVINIINNNNYCVDNYSFKFFSKNSFNSCFFNLKNIIDSLMLFVSFLILNNFQKTTKFEDKIEGVIIND